MISVLMTMSGTRNEETYQHSVCAKDGEKRILLIKVRTEAIKLMTLALMLVLSAGPPNAGSTCVDPQPTVVVFFSLD
jgi:hypothetical protein